MRLAQRARMCLGSRPRGTKAERCLLLYSRLKGYTHEEVNSAATRDTLDALIRGMEESAWSDLGTIYTTYGETLCLELMAYVARLGAKDAKAMASSLQPSKTKGPRRAR